MSKAPNKAYVFYKNLYRPGVITQPQDKKLTFVHKIVVALVLKPRKFKDIPNKISYFEWDHVKDKFKSRCSFYGLILFPIFFWYFVGKPIINHQNKWLEKNEQKKYGEIREDESFYRWL